MAVLSICVPTFNRRDKLEGQLEALRPQVAELGDDVDVWVADNCSDDDTDAFLREYRKTHGWLESFRNPENLGLVGNLYALAEHARTEMIWFISDDDRLEPGAVRRVLDLIHANEELGFIFLNHRCVIETTGKLAVASRYNGEGGLSRDGLGGVADVIRETGSQIMLISACIYRRSVIQSIKATDHKPGDLAKPLIFAVLSAHGMQVHTVKDVLLCNTWGKSSWGKGLLKSVDVQFRHGIEEILDLPRYGMNSAEVKVLINAWFSAPFVIQMHLVHLLARPFTGLLLFRHYRLRHWMKLLGELLRAPMTVANKLRDRSSFDQA